MLQCQKCGNIAPDGTTRCPRCGVPLSVAPPPFNQTHQQPPYNQQPYNNPYQQQSNYPEQKSKVAAGLLAIFVGWLGIQYFYCGKTTAGILAIVLSLVTCGVFDIIFFIQGILMLTMSDSEFYRKYVFSQSTFPLF